MGSRCWWCFSPAARTLLRQVLHRCKLLGIKPRNKLAHHNKRTRTPIAGTSVVVGTMVSVASVANATVATTTGVASTAASGSIGGTMTNASKRPPWETSQWRSFQEPAPAPGSPSPSIGGMIGTIAIAIGFGVLGAYMLDLHSHTCEACGNRWRHLGAFNLGDPVAHTCGKCGTVQWYKDGTPHVFRDALRQPPPKVLPDAMVAMQAGGAPRNALDMITSLTWAPRGVR